MEAVDIRVDDLLLRPWRADDADAVHRACQDPVLQHWAAGLPVPFPREAAHAFVAEWAPQALADGTGVNLGIFAAATGELLGSAALNEIRRDAGTADISYWSAPWARGERVTERACRVLLRWGLPGWVRLRARLFGAAQPTLTGPGGVRLRPAAERDLPGITAACRDPESVRWTTVPDPYTEADSAWFALQHAPGLWARGAGAVFVVAGPDDAYAGTIDLRISPTDPAVADVGFLIAPPARRRGYATAALRTLAAWAIDAAAIDRVEWKAHLDNAGSRRVAEKAGFTVEGVQRAGIAHRGERRDCWLGALLASDLRPGDLRPGDLRPGDLRPGDLRQGNPRPGKPARGGEPDGTGARHTGTGARA